MKKSGILIILAAVLLTVNLADVVSTWVALLVTRRGVEANLIVLLLGGPFSPAALILKLVVIPGVILVVAWYLTRRFKDPRLGIATIIAPVVMYAAVVANNVIVAAKKAQKRATAK